MGLRLLPDGGITELLKSTLKSCYGSQFRREPVDILSKDHVMRPRREVIADSTSSPLSSLSFTAVLQDSIYGYQATKPYMIFV